MRISARWIYKNKLSFRGPPHRAAPAALPADWCKAVGAGLARPLSSLPLEGEVAFAKQMTVGGLAALYFTDSKPSVSGFESERKKEPMDIELSRTAEAE